MHVPPPIEFYDPTEFSSSASMSIGEGQDRDVSDLQQLAL